MEKERRRYINNEKIVAVEVVLNLGGRADEIKGCRIRGGQWEEMSSSSTITYGVFIMKRVTDVRNVIRHSLVCLRILYSETLQHECRESGSLCC